MQANKVIPENLTVVPSFFKIYPYVRRGEPISALSTL